MAGRALLRAWAGLNLSRVRIPLSPPFFTPFNKLHIGHKKHFHLFNYAKGISMDLNSQEFQNKFEEGENGLSKESKEVLNKLIERKRDRRY